MVGAVRNHRGLLDWLIQRISAVLIGVYAIFVTLYLMMNHPLYFAQWHNLIHHTSMKIFSFIVLLSVMWHAWIGLWTVYTDYIKPPMLRLLLQILTILLLLSYLFWGFAIFWSTH